MILAPVEVGKNLKNAVGLKMMKVLGFIRFLLCLGVLATIIYITREIVLTSTHQQVRKYDNANVTHMKYGLFNVNIWKRKLARIVEQEIQNFQVDGSSKEALKKHIEAQLDVLIDKANSQVQESNKTSTSGWFKQQMMDLLVDVKDIKKGIPLYADTIVSKMTEDQTQSEFKGILKQKVRKYIDKTFEKEDDGVVTDVIKRTGAKDIEDARQILAHQLIIENEKLQKLAGFLVALSALLFVLAAYHRGRKIPAPYFFICLGALFVLLFAGVTCPMIDMDARISKFGFVLLGYNIEFVDQTVYFQSKSILDVFWIMITHAKLEMRVVGVLLILFSIVFPMMKLMSSILYYYDVFGSQKNWFVKVIVLQLGKWSMADVQIAAIMMAYIGFNGMVTTQLGIMAATVPDINLITTNGTTLQIGFYIFLTYAILSIYFSTMIGRRQSPLGD